MHMPELVFEVIQEANGGYCAGCLTENIFTQANTWDELRQTLLSHRCVLLRIGHRLTNASLSRPTIRFGSAHSVQFCEAWPSTRVRRAMPSSPRCRALQLWCRLPRAIHLSGLPLIVSIKRRAPEKRVRDDWPHFFFVVPCR